jgi:hypothetical protein
VLNDVRDGTRSRNAFGLGSADPFAIASARPLLRSAQHESLVAAEERLQSEIGGRESDGPVGGSFRLAANDFLAPERLVGIGFRVANAPGPVRIADQSCRPRSGAGLEARVAFVGCQLARFETFDNNCPVIRVVQCRTRDSGNRCQSPALR